MVLRGVVVGVPGDGARGTLAEPPTGGLGPDGRPRRLRAPIRRPRRTSLATESGQYPTVPKCTVPKCTFGILPWERITFSQVQVPWENEQSIGRASRGMKQTTLAILAALAATAGCDDDFEFLKPQVSDGLVGRPPPRLIVSSWPTLVGACD